MQWGMGTKLASVGSVIFNSFKMKVSGAWYNGKICKPRY